MADNDGITLPPEGDTTPAPTNSAPAAPSSSSAPPVDRLRPYRLILLNLQLPPGLFADLMSRAAAEGWLQDEFLWALSSTKQFNRLFPGIQSLIDQGMNPAQAVQTWRGLETAYEQTLRDAGLWHFARNKLSKENIGLAISNGLDPDELKYRMAIAEQAKRSEGLRQAINQILKQREEAQLDKRGFVQFLLGKANARVYDIVEGAQLLQELGPAGLNTKEARRLGRIVGTPGQPVDIADALVAVDQVRTALGSQLLADAGIRTADLALAALDKNLTNPRLVRKAAGIQTQLEQLLKNQQAREQAPDLSAVYVDQSGRPISGAAPQGDFAG